MATASFNQHDGRLIHGGGDISKSVWRLKVESDMAASNLLAIRRIIDLLETSTDYATDITGGLGAVILWFVFFFIMPWGFHRIFSLTGSLS